MLLHNTNHPAYVRLRPVETAWSESLLASSRSTGSGTFFDVLRREVLEVQVGDAHYQLRSPQLAYFSPQQEGPWGD